MTNDSTWLVAASQVVGIVAAELAGGDVAIGAEVAGQATRYNYLNHQQLVTANEELAACEGDHACMAEVVDRYQALSQLQDEAGYAACVDDLVACQQHSLAANGGVYAAYSDGSLWELSPEALPYMQALFDENIGVQTSFGEATLARSFEALGMSPEQAAAMAAIPMGASKSPRSPVGHRGQQVEFPNPNAPLPRHAPAVIGGREYSGHSIDRMQERGYTPTVVENTIRTGDRLPGGEPGTSLFVDRVNGVRAIIDDRSGRVITVTGGEKQ